MLVEISRMDDFNKFSRCFFKFCGILGHKSQGFFFTKKVMPIISVFPSANFPQEKYFSPSNQFFPKKSIFPTLLQSIVTRFSEKTHSQPERSNA